MAERDYPRNHPAAPDYDGTPYSPPLAPFTEDFPQGHPARHGKNCGAMDTPDGLRAFVLEQHQRNAEATAKALATQP